MSAPAARAVRAIDHIGVTVPNIEEATKFFVDAFGAEVIFAMDSHRDTSDPAVMAQEQEKLGTRAGARWTRTLVLRLGEGPSIELFEYDDPERLPPPTPGDLGIQHFGVYVEDIERVAEQVVAAGGRRLEGPTLLPDLESGDGNQWLYTLAPWGGIIELVSYPSPQAYEAQTDVRRWRPPAAAS